MEHSKVTLAGRVATRSMARCWLMVQTPTPQQAASAAWLAHLVPTLVGSVLEQTTLVLGPGSAWVALDLRLDPSGVERVHQQRLAFWTAQAGGTFWDNTADNATSMDVDAQLRTAHSTWICTADSMADCVRDMLSAMGAQSHAASAAQAGPVLNLGAGLEATPRPTRVQPNGIFLEGPLALPVGDELFLRFPAPTPAALSRVGVRVVFVRRDKDAAQPHGGFGVAPLVHESAVAEALACWCAPAAQPHGRAHPRYDTTARIRYASDDAFSEDYVTNLSFGGAFVKSATPAQVDTTLDLNLELPSGQILALKALVVVRRDDGMGVQFTLDSQTEAALAAEIARISCRPRRVLVVDDNPEWRTMLKRALEHQRLEVLEARDGRDALSLLADELMHLDLVITDVEMPVMGGIELVKKIRWAGGETDLPIVAVSAREDPDWQDEMRIAGADLALTKGMSLQELVSKAIDAASAKRQRLALGSNAPADPAAW